MKACNQFLSAHYVNGRGQQSIITRQRVPHAIQFHKVANGFSRKTFSINENNLMGTRYVSAP